MSFLRQPFYLIKNSGMIYLQSRMATRFKKYYRFIK